MSAQQVAGGQVSGPEENAWARLSFLLLETFAQHTAYSSEVARGAFRARLQEAAATLRGDPAPSQILITAGALTQAIESYYSHTQQGIEANAANLRECLRMLLGHIETVQASAPSIDQVAQVRRDLDNGSTKDARERLTACLLALAADQEERQKQSDVLMNTLRDRVTVLEQTSAVSSTRPETGQAAVDSCTGLPVRSEAEAAIQRAMAGDAQVYVAAFYVHRMSLTNARFGEAIGNQVILFCSQHISSRLMKGSDRLFRWMGPAFVALLERAESEAAAGSEVQRVVSVPLSRFFETSSRTVYLPMKMSGECIRTANRTYAEVADQMEKFFLRASHTTE